MEWMVIMESAVNYLMIEYSPRSTVRAASAHRRPEVKTGCRERKAAASLTGFSSAVAIYLWPEIEEVHHYLPKRWISRQNLSYKERL